MTTAEAHNKLGRYANWRSGTLVVTVKVTDHKLAYGVDRWEITPIEGSGSAWVQDLTWRIGE